MSQQKSFDWSEDKAPDKVTLEEFNNLLKSLFSERAKLEVLQAEADTQSKIVDELKNRMLFLLETAEMQNHKLPGIGMVSVTNYFSVTVPKEEEKREAFFAYLKKKKLFNDLITVNSATLNSFYKTEMDNAIAKGNVSFSIPGIDEPKHNKRLAMRKA